MIMNSDGTERNGAVGPLLGAVKHTRVEGHVVQNEFERMLLQRVVVHGLAVDSSV